MIKEITIVITNGVFFKICTLSSFILNIIYISIPNPNMC